MFVNLLDVQPGQRILMKNKSVAEVVENLGDGIWVKGRFIESPDDPSMVGTEDLCYCEEVLKVLDPA
jgi:hypothetical protein